MILTTHALTGAVIGKNINNIWLVIILSIVIHFIMDAFRHGEYVEVFDGKVTIWNSAWKTILDLIVGFSIILFFIKFQNLDAIEIRYMVIGALSSVFPDFITLLYWKFRWPFLGKYYAFHTWFHKYPRHALERQWNMRNAVNDMVISTLAIILLFL